MRKLPNVTAEDGKVNTTPEKFEELGKDKSSELPKFTSLSFSGLHPEIRSSKRQENDDVMFLGDTDQYVSVDILDKIWPDTPLELAAMGYYRMALHKTVP